MRVGSGLCSAISHQNRSATVQPRGNWASASSISRSWSAPVTLRPKTCSVACATCGSHDVEQILERRVPRPSDLVQCSLLGVFRLFLRFTDDFLLGVFGIPAAFGKQGADLVLDFGQRFRMLGQHLLGLDPRGFRRRDVVTDVRLRAC